MRILIVTNLYPNPRQPHRASFNRLQFAALAQAHDVRIIAPIAWTNGPPVVARVSDGMVVQHPRYVYTPKVLRGLYGYLFENSIRPAFYEQVRRWGPDVILGCWGYPDGWAALRLAREVRLPVAIKLHGSDILTLRGPRRQRTSEVLREADAVIAVSQVLCDKAIELGASAESTHAVCNGIDSSIFYPGPREQAKAAVGVTGGVPLILFAGNLLPVKGLDILIDSLAQLRKRGIAFQCVCIGHGPLKRKLLGKTARLGLSDCVRLIGPCAQATLADWYRAADLFVLPSRSEGMPNVLLEAAACGTPFVATNVGGVPEISDPASLVPPENVSALADRIQFFLNPSTRRNVAAPFRPGSWQESARALASVLGRIADRDRDAMAA